MLNCFFSSFKFEIDVVGRNYVIMSYDELLKNYFGGFKDVENMEKEVRMYEIED